MTICPAVFAVRNDKKKEKEGKLHKVTSHYISVICGADTPGPIPIKFGVRVESCNVMKMSQFCSNTFRCFRSTGGQNLLFLIDFHGHHYNSALWWL